MGFIKAGASALGKLVVIVVLAGTFLSGMIGVVYLSLRGEEVKVPEVIGRDFYESEKEIAGLGLKIKRRATRFSEEKPNTILEQLPKPGETVKTGQTILVVLSEANPEKNEAPAIIKKQTVEDEVDDSTDITADKPVKTNKNTNVKKPAQSTRDVISNKSNKNSNTTGSNSNDSGANKSSDTNKEAGNKSTPTKPNVKPTPAAPVEKSAPVKPPPAKPPTSGDTRFRRVP